MKRSQRVKIQKIHEIRVNKDSSFTESSSYWDDVKRRGESGAGNGWSEHPQANPDTLPDEGLTSPSTPQYLLGEAIAHLQGRQLEVYMLTVREGQSFAEAAEALGIEKGTVQKYKERAIKFLTQYCRDSIKRGRV